MTPPRQGPTLFSGNKNVEVKVEFQHKRRWGGMDTKIKTRGQEHRGALRRRTILKANRRLKQTVGYIALPKGSSKEKQLDCYCVWLFYMMVDVQNMFSEVAAQPEKQGEGTVGFTLWVSRRLTRHVLRVTGESFLASYSVLYTHKPTLLCVYVNADIYVFVGT